MVWLVKTQANAVPFLNHFCFVSILLHNITWHDILRETIFYNKTNYSGRVHNFVNVMWLILEWSITLTGKNQMRFWRTTYSKLSICLILDIHWRLCNQFCSVLDSKPFFNDKEEQDKLTCCAECSSSYEKEAQMFKPGQKNLLPSWLQSHNTEAPHHKVNRK